MQVVFLTERVDGMFWVNRLVDVIFLVDIVLNFFLAYFDRVEGMWMFNPKKIRARYSPSPYCESEALGSLRQGKEYTGVVRGWEYRHTR